MKSLSVRRFFNLFLALVMVICSVPMPLVIADSVTVEIVSFKRGTQEDLRSSELLEARVSGYSGNAQNLTYKWTNEIETYLYVYNSHNMYGINNTSGEVSVSPDKSYTGKGYQWASVYGANIDNSYLVGTVTVEVYDAENNLLCSDFHTGTSRNVGTNFRPRYEYSGFVMDDLADDVAVASIGMFEGDTRSILDLLGENAIVHITCSACSVSSASITSGSGRATISNNGKSVTGASAGTASAAPGDATLSVTVGKDNCKFHQYDETTATIPVFVFKKPTTTTAATTLTLTGNFDPRCTYYLEGKQGREVIEGGNRVIVFENLTPNTKYEIEIRASYTDAAGQQQTVYAWIYDTTLPVYSITVKTLLDGVLTDIEEIHNEDAAFYLGEVNAATTEVYIPLDRIGEGVYSAPVGNGRYHLWHRIGNDWHQAGTTDVIVNGVNTEMTVYHYSVRYDTNGGAFAAGEEPGSTNYAVGKEVDAITSVPEKAGYIFAGWEWTGGTVESGGRVTNGITAPIVLNAKWEKAVSVTVNVTLDHSADNDHLDMNGEEKADVTVYLTEKKAGSDGYTRADSFTYDVTADANADTTVHAPYVFNDLPISSDFSVAVSKRDYDVAGIVATKDADGNWTVDVSLVYNFDDFDLEFEVKMDDSVPTELYPKSVNVRIQVFYGGEWHTIDQLSGEGVPPIFVDISAATKGGSESYPVWKTLPNGEPAVYRIIVTSFTYADGTVVKANEQTPMVVYTDGKYIATMGDIEDGVSRGGFNGAYFEATAQAGKPDAIVTVGKYNVTFNANGGLVNGAATDVVEGVYHVPAFSGYVPTRDNYKFVGWYEDAALTVAATEAKLLTSDVTLYAKWEAIRTVTGTVTVSDTNDGITEALVELYEIIGESEILIDTQTVAIGGSYEFGNLGETRTYRVYIKAANYNTLYQNKNTASGTYNASDYVAVYRDDMVSTYVNIKLDFAPVTYTQSIEVDASAIGSVFYPDIVTVKVLYTVANSGDEYAVIVQHAADSIDVSIGADGKGSAIFELWGERWDGIPYEYQLVVVSVDGDEPEEYPIYINYGAPVRFSPMNQNSTGTLTAILMPRGFEVVFDLNAGTDVVAGMDDYKKADGRYLTHHVWSFDTEITANPTRSGYVFKGWRLATEDTSVFNGGKVLAAVDEGITLIAEWETADCQYTVEYYFDGVLDARLTDTLSAQFGSTVSAYTDKAKAGYNPDKVEGIPLTVTDNAANNVIKVYYVKVSGLSYTVNYLEKGTNRVLFAEKTEGGKTYGEVVDSADEIISIAGYTYDSADVGSLIIGDNDAANVINLYYTANSYTVSYDLNGASGEGYDDETVGYNAVITVKDAPELEGYTFEGWLADGTLYYGGERYAVTDDVTFVAQWSANPVYRITVNYIITPTNRGTLSVTTQTYELDGPTGTVNISGARVTPVNGWMVDYWSNASGEILSRSINMGSVTVEANDGDVLTFAVVMKVENSGGGYIPTPTTPTVAYYRIEHYKWDAARGIYDKADSEMKRGLIGNTVTAEPMNYEGYALNPLVEGFLQKGKVIQNKDVGMVTEMLVLKLYYDPDVSGDSTPDIFQKKVTFKVFNGTWADGTSEDKVVYLDLLDENGKYSANGSALLNPPVGMKAHDGFEGGTWNIELPEIVSGTDELVFIYSFTKTQAPEIPAEPIDPVDLTEPENPSTGDSKMLLIAAMSLASVFGIAKLGFFRRREY